MNTDDAATLATHEQELRRGTIVLASLAACRTPRYGYALLSTLADAGFQIEANTLYPLLRRLEKQGLLKAEWNTDEARPRKYYTLTDLGSEMANSIARRMGRPHQKPDRTVEGTNPYESLTEIVAQVVRRLPEGNRADIAREIPPPFRHGRRPALRGWLRVARLHRSRRAGSP